MKNASSCIVKPSKYVEIDCAGLEAKPPVSYVALFDPSRETVLRLVDAVPNMFIFIFVTLPVENLDVWGFWLPKSDYLVNPVYLGDFAEEDRAAAAAEIIRINLGG
jgi:hypothetical protein